MLHRDYFYVKQLHKMLPWIDLCVEQILPFLLKKDPKGKPLSQVEGHEDILDSRIHNAILQYLIDWKGYGLEDQSWEHTHYAHAPEKMQAFHDTHPDWP